ncbi:MAG: NAD-dependent epimerase/dehydratase family protein [Rhodothermales bacterium]|nr:NAD-dependent epimerase/dehydratase family protein [Rhodothermales bacterium]
MAVLVTGGAGFIGSHIVDALLTRGEEVHIVDDMTGGRRSNVPAAATLHEVDVRSPVIRDLWSHHRFRTMFHLAAQMDVRKSVTDPSWDADINLRGLLNLMEAGRENGLEKVVFSSTGGAIYGEPEYVPQDEHHSLKPLSPYGIAKLASEKYLYFYFDSYGIESVSLRYGNVYGPRQNPHGEAGVVAIFAQKMLGGGEPVINGDGEQTRDYVHVADVVRANMAALDVDGYDVVNIGTGRETSVNDLFRILRDELAPELEERHGPGKPGEQKRSVLAFERAEKVLGWRPEITVEDGLVETARWFADRVTLGAQDTDPDAGP